MLQLQKVAEVLVQSRSRAGAGELAGAQQAQSRRRAGAEHMQRTCRAGGAEHVQERCRSCAEVRYRDAEVVCRGVADEGGSSYAEQAQRCTCKGPEGLGLGGAERNTLGIIPSMLFRPTSPLPTIP